MPEPNRSAAAYHVQQAAEKTVKALLDHLGASVPRGRDGHNIALAAGRIPVSHPLAPDVSALSPLTPWATAWRYPPDDPATVPSLPTPAEIETWLGLVESLYGAVVAALS